MNASHDPIFLVEHDASWAAAFAAERRALRRVLGPSRFRIEHIGSTAVPGLRAKPIIDILVGCARIDEMEARIPRLETVGWAYVPEYEAELPERRFLVKPRARPRRFHLHAVEVSTAFWGRHLLFRDHLRAHPDVAAAYTRLKLELAARHRDDREAYARAKSAFIEEALRGASRPAEARE